MDDVLVMRGVTRDYPVGGAFSRKKTLRALRGIDLSVGRGRTLGLVGESGCGKSTLAKVLLGIEEATSGTVLVDGRKIESYDRVERARLIQPVFQDPYSSLNPRMTVEAIIASPLEVRGEGSRASRRARVRELAGEVGLPQHLVSAYPSQLSGGQRQRVAIARALIGEPKILICDEPTSALDVSVQSQILNLLHRLKQELNLTMILISHNLAVVHHLADEVAVMYLGQIVERGDSEAIFERAHHPYTSALLKAVLPPRPGSRLPELGLEAEFPSPLAPPPGCPFHPRCPNADGTTCREVDPPQSGTDHLYRCHHPDHVAPATQAAALTD
ncbi:oligopeptide/dipeptide ABC transporter ATP-binding protein [Aurantimonas sp. VKM B-3413]|uniref:oligopeptide/dipeptide ABC transporter ATP-binding protein n=1 Tax=Aurantimonas sp. VKM B-3413 TaxID=2779401 RepID=UPI001E3751F5|nr:oligopeptide/dipeptide ABC transporter ATP-binding protein [Aurantimonas sp. VKM B-3413]MCB8836115.1 ATP-binding cassette domain-containing protein [Aurantimonas sp. VKM B-3413]